MKLNTGSFYLTLITLSFCSILSAQNKQTDTLFIASSVNHAIHIYHQIIQKSAGLYNGSEYEEYTYNFQEGRLPSKQIQAVQMLNSFLRML